MLDEGEVLISLDVKSLYTNVPVNESITLAADLVYEIPTYTKETFVSLLKLAVQNVNFLCGSAWFSLIDGLAMGSKLAVYLANIWMKQFESIIAGRTPVATAKIRSPDLTNIHAEDVLPTLPDAVIRSSASAVAFGSTAGAPR